MENAEIDSQYDAADTAWEEDSDDNADLVEHIVDEFRSTQFPNEIAISWYWADCYNWFNAEQVNIAWAQCQ